MERNKKWYDGGTLDSYPSIYIYFFIYSPDFLGNAVMDE